MDAISKAFQSKRSGGSPALGTFVTACYPTKNDTVRILLGMQAGGADIIELGVWNSLLRSHNGPIQETNSILVALNNYIDYAAVLGLVTEAQLQDLAAPVLLMGKSFSRRLFYSPMHLDIIILCWPMVKIKPSRILLKPE